ncbi:MAG: hypothetical protein GX556_08445 [Fibrobacter sp.]|nr:hypothetical protein [Fibrobacter sp.]
MDEISFIVKIEPDKYGASIIKNIEKTVMELPLVESYNTLISSPSPSGKPAEKKSVRP